MPSLPSTRPSDARGRLSFAFVRERHASYQDQPRRGSQGLSVAGALRSSFLLGTIQSCGPPTDLLNQILDPSRTKRPNTIDPMRSIHLGTRQGAAPSASVPLARPLVPCRFMKTAPAITAWRIV